MLFPLNATQIRPLLHQLPQRTQLPQKRHPLLHRLQHVIDLRLRREPADPKPNTAMRALVAAAERAEHVARFQGRRCAGAAGGQGDVLEGHEERFAFDVGEGDVDAAGVVAGWVAVLGGVFHGEQAGEEALGEAVDVGGVVLL